MEPNYSGNASRSLADRAKALITNPKAEWLVIDAEPTTSAAIFRSYVVPLAAIGPIANLIGSLVFGYGFFGVHWRPSVPSAIGTAIVTYVLSLVSVYVLAFIVDALVPTFGGTKSPVQAFKVAAYGATASWLAGVFGILPSIAWLGLLGLYSLYLFYLGLPLLMRTPQEKALPYVVVTIIAAAVLFAVVSAIGGMVVHAFAPGATPYSADAGTVSGTINVPGGGSIDLGKVQQATAQMEATTAKAQSGQLKPIDPAKLQALLPASLSGFNRTEISSSGANAGGIGGAEADATYTSGDQSIHLKLSDLAAAGAIAALGSAFNVQHDEQTATGYEKTHTENGRLTNEKWDSSAKNGSYSVLVANRFNIEAEGNPGSVDALKAAVAAVKPDQVQTLAE
ncbi:MAG: YIP1 family protein [Sphingomonadaceae bacterium]|nr:YIP1 family protein [Sphingomonadaceae bacterium]